MDSTDTSELKGFDSFELKLGDELRGERASKGKTLLDAQRDLKIRAELIDAIENADASAFKFPGFAAGYIRSYARYLNLDPDTVYRRFCEESGFEGAAGAAVSVEPTLGQAPKAVAPGKNIDNLVVSNRFAPGNARAARVDLNSSIRGVASIAVLATLVIGLGYGGWSVLQNLQRVGFAPLPDAPEVLASAPDIFVPGGVTDEAPVTNSVNDETDGAALAALYAQQEFVAPSIEPRDGPISSIDPTLAGVYASAPVEQPDVIVDDLAVLVPAVDPASIEVATAEIAVEAVAEKVAPIAIPADETIRVMATADAWVRVRDADQKTLFTGIMSAGDRFELPAG
ncbi:MAG: helix-turn-helix domain-containing protein, partial [Pikeienuella sp.]